MIIRIFSSLLTLVFFTPALTHAQDTVTKHIFLLPVLSGVEGDGTLIATKY